jgi:hypothetical protein
MKTKVKNSKQNEKQNSFAEDLIDVLTVENDKSEKVTIEKVTIENSILSNIEFIPGLHTTWHMCVFHDQNT